MHTQEYARACTLMRSRSVESTIYNHQLNLLSTQHSLQYRPQQSGLSGNCMPCQKEAIMKAQKTTTAFYRHEKHYGHILSKSRQTPAVSVLDQCCYNMGHGSESQWVLKEAGLWSHVPTEPQRPEHRPEHITENIAKWKLVKFVFYLNLCGICHFGTKLTGTTIYYTYCKLPPISGGTDVTRTKKLLSLWANK